MVEGRIDLLPQEDLLHPPGPEKLWRESFYFNWHDLASDLVGESTVGLWPNRKTAERMMLLRLSDDFLICIEQEPLSAFDLKSMGESPLAYHCLSPLERWQIKWGGEFLVLPSRETETLSFVLAVRAGKQTARRVHADIDIEFQGLMPPYLYPPGELDFLGPFKHLEQVMRVVGTLRVGERKMSVDGIGVRDHSWGIRDWLLADEWYWFTVLFEDFFAVISYGREGDRWSGGGFVHVDGQTRPISHISIESQFAGQSLQITEANIRVGTSEGDRFHFTTTGIVLVRDLSNMQGANVSWPERAGDRFLGQTGLQKLCVYLIASVCEEMS